MRGMKLLALFAAVAASASADRLTLRNGNMIEGIYVGGTAREIRFDINGSIQTFPVDQVQSLLFPLSSYTPPPPSSSYPPPSSSAEPPPPPQPPVQGFSGRDGAQSAPPQNGPLGVTIPADTPFTVRMIDSVDSERARTGQTFRASLDEPIVIDGRTVVPRNTDVVTKLVYDQQSGKIQGRTVLTLALSSINVNGQFYDVTSNDVKTESASRGTRSAGVIGGGAAVGAIIGAIAGGGKGAAIGAASGGALGGATQVLTKGQTVKIPSETRLTFLLQNPVQL